MAEDERDELEVLKFELKFIEDGGYGRSPRTPWRPPFVFEDSLSCLNFNDPTRPHPCSECLLMQFVPMERRNQNVPCRFIPITEKGETVNYFYGYGTQEELERALSGWLRSQIQQIEAQRANAVKVSTADRNDELAKLVLELLELRRSGPARVPTVSVY
jgi:hypothetical protein